MKNTWLTSDTHYFHKNVIEYCNRPFESVEVMNDYMIEQYNKLVKPDDEVWHFGDFAMAGTVKCAEIKNRLNGKIHLILGNHDYQNKLDKKALRLGFESVQSSHKLDVLGYSKFIWFSHYPYKGQEMDFRGFKDQLEFCDRWLVHGHIHNHWKVKDKMINVGVDVWDFKPVHLDQVLAIIKVDL